MVREASSGRGSARTPAALARHDDRVGHCLRLGHPVTFGYCRAVVNGLPCNRVLDCWFEVFEVAEHLREHYSADELRRVFRPPEGKVAQILSIVKAVRAREGEG